MAASLEERNTHTQRSRQSRGEKARARDRILFRDVLCFVLCVCEEEEGEKCWLGWVWGWALYTVRARKRPAGQVQLTTRYVTYKVRRQREQGRRKKEGRG